MLRTAVAIIGAGPAGLSAAKLLAEAGVGPVTIFEARGAPGGKALTLDFEGALYELGTCYTTLEHKETNRWMRELGIKQVPLGRQMYDGAPFMEHLRSGEGPPLALEAERYQRLWRQHRRNVAQRPDDPKIVAECAQPVGEWLDAHEFVRMQRFMRRALTVMGYGFLDETATVQALRWCTPGLLASGVLGAIHMPVGGWQSFWSRLAVDMDLRLNEPVLEVVRGPAGGILRTPETTCAFNHLIVAIPLEDFAAATKLTPAEREISDAIVWDHYAVNLVRVGGWFTSYDTDAFSASIAPGAQRGHALGARRLPPRLRPAPVEGRGELFVCGTYGDPDDALLDRLLVEDIETRGGHVIELVQRNHWRFFPRYRLAPLRDGLIGKMARIQGTNSTWYSGASFSHEAVSNITGFNARLVRQIAKAMARSRDQNSGRGKAWYARRSESDQLSRMRRK